MFTRSQSKLTYLTLLLLIAAFVLSSCAGQVFSREIEGNESPSIEDPTDLISDQTDEIEDQAMEETEDEIIGESEEEPLYFITYEDARDLAIAYLLEKFALEAPGDWVKNDQTPENLLGASKFIYTSGAWVVTISAPVVAPQYMVYSLEIDQMQTGLHWEGKIDAQGSLTELAMSEPLKVLSVEDARDAVADYLIENYAWTGLVDWNESETQPIENAGLRHTFTSGPWVIQVEYLAAAPFVPEYQITADHLNLIARWTGVVESNGEIVQEAYVIN